MCNCLFCGQEMEDEEKLNDFHVCPPDQSISLNSVRVAMNGIFDKEEDGWSAWASLVDWLNSQAAQHSVERTASQNDPFARDWDTPEEDKAFRRKQ